MAFPFLMATILGILVLLIVLFIVFRKRFSKAPKPNYYIFFVLGIIWIPSGIILKNYSLAVMGLVFAIIGLAKRKDWNKKSWKDMGKAEKKTMPIIISVLIGLALLGLVFFILSEMGYF